VLRAEAGEELAVNAGNGSILAIIHWLVFIYLFQGEDVILSLPGREGF
jgi:hypothetical protein